MDEYEWLNELEETIHEWCRRKGNPFDKLVFTLHAYRDEQGTVKVDNAHWCGTKYEKYERHDA